MKILFVCTANKNRSKTFETIMKRNHKEHKVKSAGIFKGNTLNKDLLNWADMIIAMEPIHYKYIKNMMPSATMKTTIVGIADNYKYMDPTLIFLVEDWYRKTFGIGWFL